MMFSVIQQRGCDCSFNWCSLNHTAQTLFQQHKLANPACSISQQRWIAAKWSLRFGARSLWLRYRAVSVLCLCQGWAAWLGARLNTLLCRSLTAYHRQHQHRGTAGNPVFGELWNWRGLEHIRLLHCLPLVLLKQKTQTPNESAKRSEQMNTWKQKTAKNATTFTNKH